MKPPRIITIVVRGGNDFDVHEGEGFVTKLCWDEMVGQIAQMTHPAIGRPRYRMPTAEEHQEEKEDAERHRMIRRWRTDDEPDIQF